MTLLSVLDILLVIVGGAGMIYQGLCIVMSPVSYTHLTLPTICSV